MSESKKKKIWIPIWMLILGWVQLVLLSISNVGEALLCLPRFFAAQSFALSTGPTSPQPRVHPCGSQACSHACS